MKFTDLVQAKRSVQSGDTEHGKPADVEGMGDGGGACGFHGACGAALGVGTAVSVLTKATPLTGETRALANEATASALTAMLDGGPRCCKRASRKSLEVAIDFLRDRMGIILDKGHRITCGYIERNQECILEDCSYFNKGPSLSDNG